MTQLEEKYAILQEKLDETGINAPNGGEIVEISIVDELSLIVGLDADGNSWIL